MTLLNHRFVLAARPVGMPKDSDWRYDEMPVEDVGDNEVLVRVLYISLDPAMRGWMNEGKSYVEPVAIGEVMRAGGIGRVTSSRNKTFRAGDYVTGLFGVQEYAMMNARAVKHIDPKISALTVYLNALGMPGMTAYFGLLEIGLPKAGDTVVVSGAAGAVGSLVGQIAKIKGCRSIGIAGGQAKCEWIVKELGFDAAIDYKQEDVKAALKQHCPKGVDVYFDNVGGDILDAVLTRISRGARIVICGAISQYNAADGVKGPANYLSLLVNRASMKGMVVFDYADRYQEAQQAIAGWLAADRLRSREHVVEGLETFPDRLRMLFRGENTGKLVLKVVAD